MKHFLLIVTFLIIPAVASAQIPSVSRSIELSIPLEGPSQQLPEACGGQDITFGGKVNLSAKVTFNAAGGIDVKIASDRRPITGAMSTAILAGNDSENYAYSNSSSEEFEWVFIENIPVQDASGSRKVMLHIQWQFKVAANGDFSAQIQSMSSDCGV